MKEINYTSLNRDLYDQMIGLIQNLSSQRFVNLDISDDIANSVLVKYFKSVQATDLAEPTSDFIKSVFPKAVEEMGKSLWTYEEIMLKKHCLLASLN